MPEPVTMAAFGVLAAQVVETASPYLVEAGKKAAGKAGEAAFAQTVKLWDGVKGLLTTKGKGQEIAKFEADPANTDRQTVVRMALTDLLEAEPAQVAPIQALLAAAETERVAVEQKLISIGDHNKNVQITGNGNSVS